MRKQGEAQSSASCGTRNQSPLHANVCSQQAGSSDWYPLIGKQQRRVNLRQRSICCAPSIRARRSTLTAPRKSLSLPHPQTPADCPTYALRYSSDSASQSHHGLLSDCRFPEQQQPVRSLLADEEMCSTGIVQQTPPETA